MRKGLIKLPVTQSELSHLAWALELDVSMEKDMLAEKTTLLERIQALTKTEATTPAPRKKREGKKANVVQMPEKPAAS